MTPLGEFDLRTSMRFSNLIATNDIRYPERGLGLV